MTSPKALHSKNTPRWGTPSDIVERARVCLGQIDLDPASSVDFNQIVKATRIFTEHDSGLNRSWILSQHLDSLPEEGITVFLNPPGGLVKEFWRQLVDQIELGHVSKAVWIGFSVEQLCILQDTKPYPMDFATVILRKRLAFTKETGESGGAPSHGNYITGIGIDRDIFSTCFGDLGRIHFGDLA
jgi:hypothetical protein